MTVSCPYCNKSLARAEQVVTVCSGNRVYFFCSIGCRDLFGFRKPTDRICAREVCTNRVPEGNRMLCSHCHQKGNHLGEPEVSFGKSENLHWQSMERKLQGQIKGRIRIYSSQDMTQEELRALVPSLRNKAA